MNLSGEWQPNGTGSRTLTLADSNGEFVDSEIPAIPTTATHTFTAQSVSALMKLRAGDFVYGDVVQDSGSTLGIGGIGTYVGARTHLSMTWVGPG